MDAVKDNAQKEWEFFPDTKDGLRKAAHRVKRLDKEITLLAEGIMPEYIWKSGLEKGPEKEDRKMKPTEEIREKTTEILDTTEHAQSVLDALNDFLMGTLKVQLTKEQEGNTQ